MNLFITSGTTHDDGYVHVLNRNGEFQYIMCNRTLELFYVWEYLKRDIFYVGL